MKRIIVFSIVAMLLVACATQRLSPEEKAKADAVMAQRVASAIEGRSFTIDVSKMQPMRGPMKVLDSGYGLTLHGDTLFSALPYFGRAFRVPYGGGKALNFTAIISDYRVAKTKKGGWKVDIYVQNDEDRYQYSLQLYGNGAAYLTVNAQERERISFNGTMSMEDEP